MEKKLNALYCHINTHYTAYSFTANALTALALSGLAFLGVLNSVLTTVAIIVWASIFSIAYLLGKWLDQEVDDIDKLKGHMPDDCGCDKNKSP